MRLRWTEQALNNLTQIEQYISRDDPVAARRLVEGLIARGEILRDFLRLGRWVPELPGTDLRELVQGNYRIVYRVRARTVEVLTIFEAHRLFPVDELPTEDTRDVE